MAVGFTVKSYWYQTIMNKRITERHQKCSTAAEKINLLKRLNKVSITAGLVFLVIVLDACSQQETPDNSSEISSEQTDVPDAVPETAKQYVEQRYDNTQDVEEIGNHIPQWVMDVDWDTPMYVISSPDTEKFDNYAKENFPNFCDWGWTQEQSDAVYLGKGIEIINLDGGTRESGAVYYPIILNGVIVSVYEVYENIDGQELHMQAAPYFVNELNALMGMTSTDTPLILGYNNDNLIGIIGDTYYILDIDHMDHKQVDADKIPVIENGSYTVVNVIESLCAERIANVDDWHVLENAEH